MGLPCAYRPDIKLFLYKVSILFHMKPIENDCKCMQTIHVGWTDSGASGMYSGEGAGDERGRRGGGVKRGGGWQGEERTRKRRTWKKHRHFTGRKLRAG